MVKRVTTWRDDTSLACRTTYERKFALFPVKVTGGKVWMKFYYKKYDEWYHKHWIDIAGEGGHSELAEKISEEDYIVRKLAETL